MRTLLTLVVLYLPAVSQAQNAAPRPAPVISPEVAPGGAVTFRLRSAGAKEVSLRGQWHAQPLTMSRGERDVWSVTVEKVPAGVWEYSFQVDGLNVLDSLNAVLKPQREPSKSILHIAASPPKPWDWQNVPHGTVHQHEYDSKALARRREAWVYTPPGYEKQIAAKPETRFPLLVLQHGSGDSHQTWVVHGKAHWILDSLIAAGKAKPMVVLMLDGHPLGMMSRDTPANRRGAALEAFRGELFDDALPLVESFYRVEPDASRRAIAGLSMGGGQSLGVGLTSLDRFGWIGAFSAAVPASESIDAVLSNAAQTNARLKLLWIGCGKDDFLRSRNEDFIATLKSKEIQHEWALTEGNHSWPVWRGYLSDFAPKLFQEPAK